jgi:hypothetical protein
VAVGTALVAAVTQIQLQGAQARALQWWKRKSSSHHREEIRKRTLFFQINL